MERKIAELLLELGAVTLSPLKPFTWASGLHSPIYCDNRLIISHVEARRTVISGFIELFESLTTKPDVIAGTATAGIPHAAWLAEAVALPMIYVRSSEKKHGRKNMIEGHLQQGQAVLLIEDLISTGGSSINAASAITNQGGQVIHVGAIFTYEMKHAIARFLNESLDFSCLTGLSTLLSVAMEKQMISQKELELLQLWSNDPISWSTRDR